ncbi:hypothetical protein BC834DRAFT_880708 [Gloeopeniophorella convolvens]|nr:hypothetical protein BC834DRAFT_880708 [Gloeopeniophorella convolvens]
MSSYMHTVHSYVHTLRTTWHSRGPLRTPRSELLDAVRAARGLGRVARARAAAVGGLALRRERVAVDDDMREEGRAGAGAADPPMRGEEQQRDAQHDEDNADGGADAAREVAAVAGAGRIGRAAGAGCGDKRREEDAAEVEAGSRYVLERGERRAGIVGAVKRQVAGPLREGRQRCSTAVKVRRSVEPMSMRVWWRQCCACCLLLFEFARRDRVPKGERFASSYDSCSEDGRVIAKLSSGPEMVLGVEVHNGCRCCCSR